MLKHSAGAFHGLAVREILREHAASGGNHRAFSMPCSIKGDLQDIEKFLVKAAGTLQCIFELSEKVQRYVYGTESLIKGGLVDSIEQTIQLIRGYFKELIIGMII